MLLHLNQFMVFFVLLEVVDLPSHVRGAGWFMASAPAVATFMFIGLCFVGHSSGKLCYPAVLLG